MANMKFFCFSCLVILTTLHLQATHAVEYSVTNRAATTPGGVRFTNEIGLEYSKQTLISATNFIWRTFRENSPINRKSVSGVSLFIDTMDGIAYAVNNEIHVSANYIQGVTRGEMGSFKIDFKQFVKSVKGCNNPNDPIFYGQLALRYSGDVKREITGVLYHEMTHIWQWNGNGQTPGGLIEGIADFVRLKAGYAPSHWVKPGQGDRWDQGYDVTARFLDYCDSLRNGFVAELNKKMRNAYNANYFVQLLGKTVDQLWSDYKTKYK